jgi:hypothetical protein
MTAGTPALRGRVRRLLADRGPTLAF